MASSSTPSTTPPEDLEWEEWDSTTSPLSFFHHCLAGSFAGVAEHTLLYPLDTVKTCWQSQVLNGSTGGAAGCSVVESANCSVGGVVNSMRGVVGSSVNGASTAEQPRSSMPASSSNNIKSSTKPTNSALHNQGIWSTMKHLMNQGQHHTHSHGRHSVHQQVSRAHVYTIAGNPPNVVDLTASQSTSNKNKSKTTASKRPWSKHSRAIRNATIEDITAQGMIRASGSVNAIEGIGATSSLSLSSANSNNNVGFKRLWRGVQTMFVGCIPAHALYFGSYETIKSMCTDQYHPHPQHHGDDSSSSNNTHKEGHVGHDTLSTTQAMLAGGVATLLHDFVMTPMDTMKQRMQLGHYDNLRHAFASIVWGDGNKQLSSTTATSTSAAVGEGWKGLYRSFPITVMTNVPYGMIMMTTNEWLRGVLEDGMYGTHAHHQGEVDNHPFHFGTILFSGMGAGMVASAATAPLDRIKTRLQTQRMGMVLPTAQSASTLTATADAAAASRASSSSAAIMEERALAAAMGEPKVCPKMAVQNAKRTLFPSSAAASSMNTTISSIPTKAMSAATTPFKTVHYTTPMDAFQSIIQEEGIRGLFRGTLPRVALHAPSVAISWTAYEMAKDWLVWMQQQH